MRSNNYCVVCGKLLFQNGKRLEKVCYYVDAGCRITNNDSLDRTYLNNGLSYVEICQDCFMEKNKQKITDILFGKIFYGDEEVEK